MRDINEKAYTAWFPELTPRTLITRSLADKQSKPGTTKVQANDPPRITQAQLKFAGLNLDFSIAKARTKLGYEPRVLFDEGMKRALEWYREAVSSG